MSSEYQPRTNLTAPQKGIIEATIEILAKEGYAHTSIGSIARELKLSKGNIQYHFATKEILMQEAIAYIYNVAFRDIRPRIDTAGTPWERIQQFISGSIEFYQTYPTYIRALRELKFNFRPTHHRSHAAVRYEKELADVAELLREGQQKGAFRPFDTTIMALTIRQGLDGLSIKMSEPGYDIAHHEKELLEILRRAIVAQ